MCGNEYGEPVMVRHIGNHLSPEEPQLGLYTMLLLPILLWCITYWTKSIQFFEMCGNEYGEPVMVRHIDRYKTFVHFKAFVHESIILCYSLPICIADTIATPLHDYCAIYDLPVTPLLYAIHHTILIVAISYKG